MTAPGEMLLLADRRTADQLGARIRPHRLVTRADPYEALLQMHARDWDAVVLTAPRPQFGALARASRRLLGRRRLFALCPPAAEPDLLPLAGKVLDDYFIWPPTPDDLSKLLPAFAAPPSASATAPKGTAPATRGLTAAEYGELVDAACSVESLEAQVAAMVTRRIGAIVKWTEVDDLTPQMEVLLLAESPRALVAESYRVGRAKPVGAFLSAVQHCLGALTRAAGRTDHLHRLAVTDYLTGAYNRRYFYFRTERILQRARAEGFRAALLLYDIDNFKQYNDRFGHAVGDEILKETAALMRDTTRAQDVVARIGGDEFAILFWDAQPRTPDSQPPESALVLAERFREALRAHTFGSLGPTASGRLTISGGLASFPRDGDSCRELLRSADRGLRQTKESGKDGIHLVGEE